MKSETIRYADKDYLVSKIKGCNLYNCKSENESYEITGEQLEVLKEIIVKMESKESKKEEFVSFYNDMIAFNPYQYKPYLRLISEENTHQAVYIADEVGVGKTFETGIIISELLYSGRVGTHEPILIVCPNMLCRKWQEVLDTFFGLSSSIIKDLSNVAGISIISFNNISRLTDEGISEAMGQATKFGALIVDEAHNVGERFDKLLKLRQAANFKVILSATPLNGKNNDAYKQRGLLFDTSETIQGLFSVESPYFNRTLKEEMREGEVNWNIENLSIKNPNLLKYVDIIDDIFEGRNTLKKFVGLNMINSSPAAAKAYCKYLLTLDEQSVKELFISSKLKKEDYEDQGYDFIGELIDDYDCLEDMQDFFEHTGHEVSEDTIPQILEKIKELEESITLANTSQDDKLMALKGVIKSRQEEILANDESSYYKKMVVFVNYNETARYLTKNIPRSILINGSIPTDEKLSRFKAFESENSGKDILIITNVACEGLDMDFCNAIVNYDLTYNPVQLAQRKGRIDRFKITCIEKYIYNFINEGVDPTTRQINDFVDLMVKDEASVLQYKNSIYPVLLRKLDTIKIETGVYYNVIDGQGKTYESEEKMQQAKLMAKKIVIDLFNGFYNGEKFTDGDVEAITSHYQELHGACYDKVNGLLKEKRIRVNKDSGKLLIEVDANNREFLKYVYDGGTVNSHLIHNK